MQLQTALVAVILLLLGAGIGAFVYHQLISHSARQLGFVVTDAHCVECQNPVSYFNGKALLHWSQGGYLFCSNPCVDTHRQRHAELVWRALGPNGDKEPAG